MSTRPVLSLVFLLSICGACAPDRTATVADREKPGADRLWYRQPAGDWNGALPVGNGRLGAMVFGYPDHEKLQLNEETLWAGWRYQSRSAPGFSRSATVVVRSG